MDASPIDFWPAELLTAGTQWVKEQLKLVSQSEDELIRAVQSRLIVPNASLFACALSEEFQILRPLIPADVRSTVNDMIQRVSSYLRIFNFNFLQANRDGFRTFWLKEFDKCVAETGNYMVLGLLNDPESAPRGRWNSSWNLTFEPTSNGPVVEEKGAISEVSRKRGREWALRKKASKDRT